jgi:hypothetical protein
MFLLSGAHSSHFTAWRPCYLDTSVSFLSAVDASCGEQSIFLKTETPWKKKRSAVQVPAMPVHSACSDKVSGILKARTSMDTPPITPTTSTTTRGQLVEELAGRFLASMTATGSRFAAVHPAPCAFVQFAEDLIEMLRTWGYA